MFLETLICLNVLTSTWNIKLLGLFTNM